jgi:hypothetical protein
VNSKDTAHDGGDCCIQLYIVSHHASPLDKPCGPTSHAHTSVRVKTNGSLMAEYPFRTLDVGTNRVQRLLLNARIEQPTGNH